VSACSSLESASAGAGAGAGAGGWGSCRLAFMAAAGKFPILWAHPSRGGGDGRGETGGLLTPPTHPHHLPTCILSTSACSRCWISCSIPTEGCFCSLFHLSPESTPLRARLQPIFFATSCSRTGLWGVSGAGLAGRTSGGGGGGGGRGVLWGVGGVLEAPARGGPLSKAMCVRGRVWPRRGVIQSGSLGPFEPGARSQRVEAAAVRAPCCVYMASKTKVSNK
jgi:hypothetical protein